MNYIGKVLNNVRDFYNDINAATLTGAIDVVVVEQPDGTFTCSPFHVRFGKLGVLRSREKVVDIEVNGEPLDIHMKLGESGEAFFVEEIPRAEAEACPAYLACSPIPSEGEQLMMAQFGPDVSPSDHSPTDSPPGGKVVERELFPSQPAPPLSPLHEHTETPQQPRTFRAEAVSEKPSSSEFRPIQPANQEDDSAAAGTVSKNARRKRRRKSQMKKKSQLKKAGSNAQEEENGEDVDGNQHSSSATPPPVASSNSEQPQEEQTDEQIQFDMEDVESDLRCTLHLGGIMLSGSDNSAQLTYSLDCKECEQRCSQLGLASVTETETSLPRKPADLHFFSDTEATPGCSPHGSRPSSPTPQSDSELELQRQSSAAEQTQLEAQLQAELGANSKQSWKWGELPSPPPQPMLRHSQDTTGELQAGQQVEPHEQQQQQQQQQQRSSMLSGMWSLMRSHNRHRAAQPEGVYLDELDVNSLDPEVAALYFPPSYRGGHRPSASDQPKRSSLTESGSREEEDTESGKGPSLSQSPHSVEGAIGGPKLNDSDFEDLRSAERKLLPDLAISLCGPLDMQQPPTEEAFSCALVSYAELQQNPAMLENPSLVVRLHGRLQTWREAAPEVLSLLLFQQPLSQPPSISPKEEIAPEVTEGHQQNPQEPNQQNATQTSSSEPSRGYSWFSWGRSGSVSKKSDIAENRPTVSLGEFRRDEEDELRERSKEVSIKEGEGYSGSNSSDESDTAVGISIPGSRKRLFEDKDVMYRKTLRLSSDQIKSLLLNEGANEVVFSVTTAYQGTSRCKCHVYRWRWDDKIVISDIDGTITKSDVLGHILPIVGKDWAQSGVAQLFTKVKNNGYRLLYLSARAIGQARVTREYLKSIKQGDLSLPEGPLLLSPTSLISAFHREVIEKKPEEFKISCLRDIQALFPNDSKPFYAGYGNKINDVWAYRAVGIPIFRIFTINHKGELKHELTQTFQSSYFGQSDAVDELFPPIVSAEYSNMSYIVDQMFPPPPEDTSATEDFNNFNYWREPIPELDPLLLPPVPTSPTTKGRTPVKETPSPIAVAK